MGNTSAIPSGNSLLTAHPHLRGEHVTITWTVDSLFGSSPPAWGTRSRTTACATPAGLIPTCVGNTIGYVGRVVASRAHPHLRGEHCRRFACWMCRVGSSPPAWGTHIRYGPRSNDQGLIPTCVGNTSPVVAYRVLYGAHPHLRGEHLSLDLLFLCFEGSSPPAWGTRHRVQEQQPRLGLIPTCVGNTRPAVLVPTPQRAHPHLRGEHGVNGQHVIGPVGSSPPAWGTPDSMPAPPLPCRLIPTCVGNTRSRKCALTVWWAHPHLRGEHTHQGNILGLNQGSSPPAWGTPRSPP